MMDIAKFVEEEKEEFNLIITLIKGETLANVLTSHCLYSCIFVSSLKCG